MSDPKTLQRIQRSERRQRAIADIASKPLADITALEHKRLTVLMARQSIDDPSSDDDT